MRTARHAGCLVVCPWCLGARVRRVRGRAGGCDFLRGCGGESVPYGLVGRVHGSGWGGGVRVRVEAEEGAEAEVLHDGELGQDFGVVHFQHALVDLAPAGADAGDVVEHRRVLPKGAPFHVVDEADGAEVHVLVPLPVDGGEFGYVGGVGRVGAGTFDGGRVVGGDGGAVLGAAEDVGDEGVVV